MRPMNLGLACFTVNRSDWDSDWGENEVELKSMSSF